MARYRKKPVIIEAFQHDGSKESLAAILRQSTRIGILPEAADGTYALSLRTLEGIMVANAGDWVVQGIAGEFYPVRDDIFRATYEAVADEHTHPPASPPEAHWALQEAWGILNTLRPGLLNDDTRAYLAGRIAGAIVRHAAPEGTRHV